MNNTYTCPYCLTKFPYTEVWFKCLQPSEASKKLHINFLKGLSFVHIPDSQKNNATATIDVPEIDNGGNGKDKKKKEQKEKKEKKENKFDNFSELSKKDAWKSYRLPISFFKNHELKEILDLPNSLDYPNICYDDKPTSSKSIEVLRTKLFVNSCFKATKHNVNQYNPREVPKVAKCPYCKGVHQVHTHVCPNPFCNREITIKETEKHYIINLAGGKSNGKTVYLGSLLYSIEKYIPTITGWTVTLDANADDLKKKFIDYMTDSKNKLPETTRSNNQREGCVDESKLYSVSLTKGQETYTFIFYDVEGELFCTTNESKIYIDARTFSHPDFIIAISDPSNFIKVRRAVAEDTTLDGKIKEAFNNSAKITQTSKDDEKIKNTESGGDEVLINQIEEIMNPKNEKSVFDVDGKPKDKRLIAPSPEQIITQTAKFLRCLYSLDPRTSNEAEGMLKVPIALCVTKSDLISHTFQNKNYADIFTPSSLTSDNIQAYEQWEKDYFERSRKLKEDVLLSEWRTNALVTAVDSNFHNSYYCAVSARGCDVTENVADEDTISPINILDPFVWFLRRTLRHIFDRNTDAGTTTSSNSDII